MSSSSGRCTRPLIASRERMGPRCRRRPATSFGRRSNCTKTSLSLRSLPSGSRRSSGRRRSRTTRSGANGGLRAGRRPEWRMSSDITPRSSTKISQRCPRTSESGSSFLWRRGSPPIPSGMAHRSEVRCAATGSSGSAIIELSSGSVATRSGSSPSCTAAGSTSQRQTRPAVTVGGNDPRPPTHWRAAVL
jgi:hypothetical protein